MVGGADNRTQTLNQISMEAWCSPQPHSAHVEKTYRFFQATSPTGMWQFAKKEKKLIFCNWVFVRDPMGVV